MKPDTLPPHVPEAEKSAIGCAFQEPTLACELKAEWFYNLRYRTAAEVLIGMAHAAKSIGNLTKRRLYQLADEHKIPQPTNGCFPMLETITAMFSYYQRDGADLQRERLLKTAADRKLRELELGVADEKLMSRKIAENTISAALKQQHGIVRAELERTELKAIAAFHESLGLSDANRAALREFHTDLARQTVDAVETAYQAVARGEAPAQEILPDKPAEKQDAEP